MPKIVVIGAGCPQLVQLLILDPSLHGFEDFTIYEKGSDVGGTWKDNIYPGAASDVSTHLYSASTDLNPDWSVTRAPQAEMFEYWRKLTAKYNLYRHIVFNRSVVSAEWNTKEQLYNIVTEDVQSGDRFSTTAKILISAIGTRYPNIAGLSSFKGDMFHSPRWNTGVDLRGKRVAVIGNGASARARRICHHIESYHSDCRIQFIPLITKDETVQVTEFCRSPNWFVPAVIILVYFGDDVHDHILKPKSTSQGRWLNLANTSKYLMSPQLLTNYIKLTAPKEYHEFLVPEYRPGCKRLLLDTNFLRSLHQLNITLNWDGIQSTCEDGIGTKKGQRLPFDVVIFATGFTAVYAYHQ
ncbi:FAD/NAD(P)-binding domain-containing protein [Mycena sanguinolenta]|uniref:FAD/NAD(P)-binding domain-containing protein n=1 Tax=Mycena sanguinolenta TaxID=230812 RepID=A0A8H6XJY9_9AGAR|nr:FAD/NAD(P)-binding domain-containing protein [Mycena sanguinolenta]